MWRYSPHTLHRRLVEDILTGFVANEKTFEAYGRPVGVTVAPDGSLLVADDGGGKIWRARAIRV